MIIMPEEGEYIRFKSYEWKVKSLFMIYADFESILVSENYGEKSQTSHIRANIKNILLAVMVIN